MTSGILRMNMSAVYTFRSTAFVLAGALLSACGGNVTGPRSTQVTVAVNLNPPATGSGSLAITATTASSVPVALPPMSSVLVTSLVNGSSAEVIRVTKCYTNATATAGGELLIKAQSSDKSARLFAYRPDGTVIGELQNGGGNRYGGTVVPYQKTDPVEVTVRSSAGGSITVPTTPFPPND